MTLIPTLATPLESMIEIDKEKALTRLRAQEEELIDELGQDSDQKAVSAVKEYVNEQQQEQDGQQIQDVESLKVLSRNKKNYQRYLLVCLQRFVKQEDIPKKYACFAESNDVGIVLGLEGTSYMAAFKVCGDPFYDLNACKILAIQLGNTVARMEGHFRATESGILLATKQEAEIAKKQWTALHPQIQQ